MGLYDRDYVQDGYQGPHGPATGMRFSFPRLTPVVKWLLIANIAVFFLQGCVAGKSVNIHLFLAGDLQVGGIGPFHLFLYGVA